MPVEMIGELMREQIASGLWKNQHRSVAPLWADGENVYFESIGVRKMPGWGTYDSSTIGANVVGAGHGYVAGEIFFGSPADLWHWNGVSTLSNVSSSVGAYSTGSLGRWSFQRFGDAIFAVNGRSNDNAQVYSGTSFGVVSDLPNGAMKAEIVRALNGHLIYISTDEDEDQIRWSDAGVPQTLTVANDNTAGYLYIRGASAPKAAEKLQNGIAVYTSDEVYMFEYVGSAAFTFRIRPLLNGIGAFGKDAVVPVGRIHYGWGPGGIWRTDGASFNYIDDPAIRDYIKNELQTNKEYSICGYHNEAENTIVWFFPDSTSTNPNQNTAGVAYNYANNTWSVLDFGRSSCLSRGPADYPVTAAYDGAIYNENLLYDAGNDPLVAWVRTKGLDMGDSRVTKHIAGVRVGYVGEGTNYFRVGFKTEPHDDYINWLPYQEATSDEYVHLHGSGKLVYFEFYSEDEGSHWRLQNVEFFGEAGDARP